MALPVILNSAAIGFVLPAHAPRGLIMTRPTAPLRVPKLAAYDPALEQAVDAAVEGALEKAAAVAASSSASFWQLAFVFVCGGLFFSAVAAAVGAVYAVGLDNARRGFRLFGLLWRRVWAVMAAALRAAKSEVLNNDTTRWKEVWALLGQGFGEAKRAAAEGVEAIRAEAGLYAFALGAPGLLTLQYVVDRLAPCADYCGSNPRARAGLARLGLSLRTRVRAARRAGSRWRRRSRSRSPRRSRPPRARRRAS